MGQNHLTRNILFNSCRESGDHGPFNSWDRQAWFIPDGAGGKTGRKAVDVLDKNIMLAN